MKTIYLLLVCLMAVGEINAQELAMRNEPAKNVDDTKEEQTAKESAAFCFQLHGIDLCHMDLEEYPKHFLGDSVARKKQAFLSVYVQRPVATLGFSSNDIDIYKPSIYNAVSKVENYLKKAVRKQEITNIEASAYLAKCLDVAYLAYYEENTDALEKALKKAKTPQELLQIFQSVAIEE